MRSSDAATYYSGLKTLVVSGIELRVQEPWLARIGIPVVAFCMMFIALLDPPRGAAVSAVGSAVTCPSAPLGWSRPPVDRSEIGPNQAPGVDQLTISCMYVRAGKAFSVWIDYALQSDPNPIYDFSFGCGNQDVSWTSGGRRFLVMSRNQWAYATFTDYLKILTNGDVPRFEQVARTMLARANRLGHPCEVDASKTTALEQWLFSFKIQTVAHGTTVRGAAQGSFSIHVVPGARDAAIPYISADNITVELGLKNAGHQAIVLKILRGISFTLQRNNSFAELSLGVQVSSSSDKACARGSRGTLTLRATAAPTITLSGCSSLAALGPLRVSARVQRGA